MKKNLMKSLGSCFLILSLFITGGSEARAFQVAGGSGTLVITLRLPKNYEFTPKAPFSIEISSPAPKVITFAPSLLGQFGSLTGSAKIPFTAYSGTALVTIKAKLFYCDKASKLCRQNIHETLLAFEIAPKGSSTISYYWDIIPKTDPGTNSGRQKTK